MIEQRQYDVIKQANAIIHAKIDRDTSEMYRRASRCGCRNCYQDALKVQLHFTTANDSPAGKVIPFPTWRTK